MDSITQPVSDVKPRRARSRKQVPAGQRLMLIPEAQSNNAEGLRWCPDCQKYQSVYAFYSNGYTYCRVHMRERNAASHALRPTRDQRNRSLRRHYGITHDDYDAMFLAQGGVCASCGQPETSIEPRTGEVRYLYVDHDHATGRVRALLCFGCNAALGQLREDPARIRALLAYAEGL